MPNELHLIVGYSCNNRCVHCFMEDTRTELRKENKPLDKKTEEIKGEIEDAEIDSILFTGGEPTIRRDFFELLRFAKDLGLPMSLQTNGRAFSVEKFVKKTLKTAPMISFTIALHSHKPDVHDAITRVDGSWTQTIEGVKNLKNYGASRITLRTVILKSNYKDLDKIVEFGAELGVNNIDLTFPQMGGNSSANWSGIVPRYSEIGDYLRKAIEKAIELNVGVKVNAVPFCFLRVYEKYSGDIETVLIPYLENRGYKRKTHDKEEDVIKDLETGRRAKTKKCCKCKFFNVCVGVWKEYLELYGLKEFNPVGGGRIDSIDGFLAEIGRVG